MDSDPVDLFVEERHQKIREARNMIEVGMRQKDVKLSRCQASGDAKERSPGVEDYPHFRQHDAGRVPAFVGVISPGAEKVDSQDLPQHISFSRSLRGNELSDALRREM